MPNPSELEREMRELLQRERERNGSVQEAAEKAQGQLAPLDFKMFLSPSAQREVEAMLGPRDLLASITAPVTPADQQGIDIEWPSTETETLDFERIPEAVPNLFMNRALREIEASVVSFDDGIEFDPPPRYGSSRSGGGEGVVVARRGPDGFTPLSRQEAVARYESRQPQTAAPPTRVVTARPAPVQSRAEPKSCYERLLGPSVID